MDAHTLKELARACGADLVGIAPIERFAALPPETNPRSIAPECRSVIVLGRRILRGSLRGVEEGTNFGSTYNTFGYTWLEDNFLAQTTYDLTIRLEEQGIEAVPLFGYTRDGMAMGAPVAPGKPAPNVIVDLEFAAQAAGLAEIGLGGFLLTPEFGTRQRFATILVDAEIEPDAIRDKSLCGNCAACIEACPLGAYDATQRELRGVPGAEMPVAKIDYEICRACRNGALHAGGRGTRPDRLAAACARACLVRLELGRKCANMFENRFRQRQPWAVNALGRPTPVAPVSARQLGCDGPARGGRVS